jgi:hypothetical protein
VPFINGITGDFKNRSQGIHKSCSNNIEQITARVTMRIGMYQATMLITLEGNDPNFAISPYGKARVLAPILIQPGDIVVGIPSNGVKHSSQDNLVKVSAQYSSPEAPRTASRTSGGHQRQQQNTHQTKQEEHSFHKTPLKSTIIISTEKYSINSLTENEKTHS